MISYTIWLESYSFNYFITHQQTETFDHKCVPNILFSSSQVVITRKHQVNKTEGGAINQSKANSCNFLFLIHYETGQGWLVMVPHHLNYFPYNYEVRGPLAENKSKAYFQLKVSNGLRPMPKLMQRIGLCTYYSLCNPSQCYFPFHFWRQGLLSNYK